MNNTDSFVLILTNFSTTNSSFNIRRLLPSQKAMKKSSEVTKNCPKCRLSLRNQSQSQGGKIPLGVTFSLINFSGSLINSLEVLYDRYGSVLKRKMAGVANRHLANYLPTLLQVLLYWPAFMWEKKGREERRNVRNSV